MRTIVVAGALANKCGNGGEAWVRMSWAVGLRKLGFNVVFVEQIASETCVNAEGVIVPFEDSTNVAYFRDVMALFGFDGSSALVYADGEHAHGLSWEELLHVTATADLLVNISGHLRLDPLFRQVRRKAYIDIDPGFTQFWQAQGNPGSRLEGHDFYFTIGENVGYDGCSIPTGGFRWRPTRQPVVLDHWPVVQSAGVSRFTTVANWRGPFGPVEHEGRTYRLKAHEFRKFLELPERSHNVFEIALGIHPADDKDLLLLLRHRWHVVDPVAVADGPEKFRQYVQGSSAEFSVAQGIYVDTLSGWFSDRSTRYLASGKPVLVQDTGFARHLPVGEGLVAFRTLDEAIAGAEKIGRDYEQHCSAAREIAEAYFDSDKVLGRFVEEVGLAV